MDRNAAMIAASRVRYAQTAGASLLAQDSNAAKIAASKARYAQTASASHPVLMDRNAVESAADLGRYARKANASLYWTAKNKLSPKVWSSKNGQIQLSALKIQIWLVVRVGRISWQLRKHPR